MAICKLSMEVAPFKRLSKANLMLGQPLRISVGMAMEQEANRSHVEERIAQELESLIARDLFFRERIRRVYESRP